MSLIVHGNKYMNVTTYFRHTKCMIFLLSVYFIFFIITYTILEARNTKIFIELSNLGTTCWCECKLVFKTTEN